MTYSKVWYELGSTLHPQCVLRTLYLVHIRLVVHIEHKSTTIQQVIVVVIDGHPNVVDRSITSQILGADIIRCDPDRSTREGIPTPYAYTTAHKETTVWHVLGSIPCNTVCLTYTVPRACQTGTHGARDHRMEQVMSAKRQTIPQMESVQAVTGPGQTDLEHRGPQWYRRPRDLQQTTDREE
jgi:hypothetical protein